MRSAKFYNARMCTQRNIFAGYSYQSNKTDILTGVNCGQRTDPNTGLVNASKIFVLNSALSYKYKYIFKSML